MIDLGINFPDADQGWYVPRYVTEGDKTRGVAPLAPELRSVADLVTFKKVFAVQADAQAGLFMNCPKNWGCFQIDNRKLRAYGLEGHFVNQHAADGDTLTARIADRYASGKPFLTYYWSPTWVLGTFDLVRLEEPEYEAGIWYELLTRGDARRATAYPPATVIIGAGFALSIEAPELTRFLRGYATDGDLVSGLLAERRKRDLDFNQTAVLFMKRYPERWKHWVATDVAASLQSHLEKIDEP